MTTAALTATAALALTACGGGGGTTGGSDKIASSPTTTTASAAPTTTAQAAGAPLKIDPSLALPGDLKAVFDWTTPTDHAEAAALSGAANYLQAIDHAVAKQNKNDPGLHAFAAADALSYAQNYVQENVADKETLTGTDRYFRPTLTKVSSGTAVDIKLCNNQSKLYSKVIATGKVHVTQESDEDYVLFDITMVKVPTATELWQANGIVVKERSLQCKQ